MLAVDNHPILAVGFTDTHDARRAITEVRVAQPEAQSTHRRPSAALLAAYQEVARCFSASCVFSDAQDRNGTLASAIKPLLPVKLVGPAVTVRLMRGDLQDPLDVLAVASADDVVVVDAGGETETAVWGGLMGSIAHARGIAGAVIDGAVRDTDELRQIPFQVFSRSVVSRGTHTMMSSRREQVSVNIPITVAGVLVSPGDMVIGDEVGITVVPRGKLHDVLSRAREQAQREQATRDRIAEGTLSIDDLLDEFGRI